jgi:hypothetical protein
MIAAHARAIKAGRARILDKERNSDDQDRKLERDEMLQQGLVDQAEFDKLRVDIMEETRPMPAIGNIGRPYSIPPAPSKDVIIFRHPTTGKVVTIKEWPTFWLTVLLGCFYLAYKEVWLHAAIALVLAIFTSGLSWLVYPFFAYRLVVDGYRRKGWLELTK